MLYPLISPPRNNRVARMKPEESMWTTVQCAVVVITLSTFAMAGPAMAAEITIFANQGAASATRDLAPAFERASGNKVVVKFMDGRARGEAIKSNTPGDVVSSLSEAFDGFVKDGKVVAGSVVEYARAGNGV